MIDSFFAKRSRDRVIAARLPGPRALKRRRGRNDVIGGFLCSFNCRYIGKRCKRDTQEIPYRAMASSTGPRVQITIPEDSSLELPVSASGFRRLRENPRTADLMEAVSCGV